MISSEPRNCINCDAQLAGRQRLYCSVSCSAEFARAKRLADQYSITTDEYDRILSEQRGGCGICERPPRQGKRLAVDHDHQTGLVRGLLCFFCNKRVLGARSAEVIIKTAAYVSDPPAIRVIGNRVAAGRPKKKRKTTRRKRKR